MDWARGEWNKGKIGLAEHPARSAAPGRLAAARNVCLGESGGGGGACGDEVLTEKQARQSAMIRRHGLCDGERVDDERTTERGIGLCGRIGDAIIQRQRQAKSQHRVRQWTSVCCHSVSSLAILVPQHGNDLQRR